MLNCSIEGASQMLNFQPDNDQQLIRETVAQFAREQIRPVAHDADESGTVPDGLVQQAWNLGLIQGNLPEKYGGAGSMPPSAVTGALIWEELTYGDLSIALHILAPQSLLYPLIAIGSDAQQNETLPRYLGTSFTAATAALIEPRYDFDVNDLKTTARPCQVGYILNGIKCLVPLAAESTDFLVYARTEKETAAFLIHKDTDGIEVGDREKNLGLQGLATYELRLVDCIVPEAALLRGNVAPLLNRCRVALAASAVGLAKASYDYARNYALERHAFGKPIAQKQAIAFMLAEMAMEIDAARLLTWEAAWKLDTNGEATRESCLAKNYAADMVLKTADNAVQTLGGHGYIRDHPVERWLRNARGFNAFEGLAIV